MSETFSTKALLDAASVEYVSENLYDVELSEFYTVVGKPNGGYLQCVLANAALAAASNEGAPHIHATAITTNYMNAPDLGPAQIRTDVRRVGRGASFVHAELVQNGVMTTESLVTLGTLRDNSLPRYHDATVPFVPPIEDCVEAVNPAGDVGIMTVADLRLDPDCAKWWFGEAVEKGELRGWLRLNDDSGAHWDAWSVLFASDVLPPATFPLGSSGWVPTLQLSSYVRAVPASEWLRVRQWCVVIEDGLVDEQCELFDDQGHLVASSKQLAMVRFHESS